MLPLTVSHNDQDMKNMLLLGSNFSSLTMTESQGQYAVFPQRNAHKKTQKEKG